ncbi:carbohydrate kinase family protein [Rhodanobacter glycinis]|jgi:sugar/nucleoside kinase (ribokinase family)|uniref:Sugar or nucleoside kinase, ribokinase family n=1 Tax=Rhodanobacter glycinis TaxID=582702 RepID=A0A1I4FYQ1_9GAMM|nr:sugar kinase [Rhodanobacter glycinis]SFL22629.1 Sugar or nucleoside kinase, ribokinase family [Rhodanobacter glycinis]
MKRVLVAGEINVDLVFKGCRSVPEAGREVLADDFVMTPGSSSMICAMGLARLGSPVAFHGRLGADSWGDYCLGALRGAGIETTTLQSDATLRTGITASLSTSQDRALVTFPGAIGELREADITDAMLAAADHLHVSSYYLQRALRPRCRELFARARAAGLSTSLDPGFDPENLWGLDIVEVLREVDVFLPNEDELLAITGSRDVASALRMLGKDHTLTVVKRGRHGCAVRHEGRMLEVPAFAVDAVDSTGAGDSFDAGFLHAWLGQQPLQECLRWGSACGSLSTRAVGGTSGQPGVAELQALLAEAP